MKTTIEKRIFRLEMMMYFVVAKLGVDGIKEFGPIITQFWSLIW